MLLSSEMVQEALMEELAIPHPYSTHAVTPIEPIQMTRISAGPQDTVKDVEVVGFLSYKLTHH
jgi:hypothetical protein